MREGSKNSLKLMCISHLKESLMAELKSNFKDLERPDVEALRNSLIVC